MVLKKSLSEMTSIDISLKMLIDNLTDIQSSEKILVENSLGRVTGCEIVSIVNCPNVNSSAMDGIAVIAHDTLDATENNKITLHLNENFIFVNTSNAIKSPYDSVIKYEDLYEINIDTVVISSPARRWKHIKKIGCDISIKQVLLPKNHIIRAIDIGLLLYGGAREIDVVKKPKVGILPTGSEIKEIWETVESGDVVSSNSKTIANLVVKYGGIPNEYKCIKDDLEYLKDTINIMSNENDIIVINGGSSAGKKDFTSTAVSEIGKLVVHGIAISPGKSAILGIVNKKPLIGLPGFPFAAYVISENFVKPLIEFHLGIESELKIIAAISEEIVSSKDYSEFIPVNLSIVNGMKIATPIDSSLSLTLTLAKADGLLVIPQNVEKFELFESVEVLPLK
jgi:putative molybdopterin biosynthesis protein